MYIYISSSWKNRDGVRLLADKLRRLGHTVYDFTDPGCKKNMIPPEMFPEEFDPEHHKYSEYINKVVWALSMDENRRAIERSDMVVLLLPCGNDAHADWAYGVGLGKYTVVVGHPGKGHRSPVHLWADRILDSVNEFCLQLADNSLQKVDAGSQELAINQ